MLLGGRELGELGLEVGFVNAEAGYGGGGDEFVRFGWV